ncbi:SPOR domain-containing protein [Roseomonas sp. BN140053]|uniref:SPOR domain-containing protein n=1 Tax=Roseomonas sp. BN140053 TaxID=3391898 RepID=UPI0039EA53C4
MSDITVPSYRVQRETRGIIPWRMLAVSGGILAVLGVGGAAVWGLTRAVSRGVPVIEADSRPFRIRPDDPGGLRVANQEERIFDTQRAPAGRAGGRPGQASAPQVAPEPERPDLTALRQATAPRAPAPAAPSAAPAAAPNGGAAATAAAPRAEPVPPVAARAEPPAAPRTPAAVASGRAVVQLGALSSEESAQAEWTRLKGRLGELLADRRPQVLRFERDGKPTMYRLRTGGFADTTAAKAFCDAARAKGASACAAIGG